MAENAIVVAGWALMPPSNDVDEPRVRDTDLAERLGYDRPRKFRELVSKMVESNELPGILVRPGYGRGRNQHGETSAVIVTNEFWLTEREALLVCARSEAPRAHEVRAMLVDVFIAYRRGQLAPVIPSELGAAIAALSAQIASLASIHDRVAALEAVAPHARQPLGVIGRIGASVIRGRLRDYARLLEVPNKRGSRQSHLRAADQELRERIGYPMSRGSSWDMLDQSLEGMAARHLHQMIERAQRFTSERQPTKQTTLWSLKGGA
jgi:hypothetical protein